MANKINLIELLEDCPEGMELDCPLFDGLEFDHIDKNNGTYSIICRVKTEFNSYNIHTFTEYGCYSTENYSKCAIFPKGKTTWEGFQRPFKDGDIVATKNGFFIGIIKVKNNMQVGAYCAINDIGTLAINVFYGFERLASKEEKTKLFQTIKDNGYQWNAETKTLEKLIEPKFKVGDRVKYRSGEIVYRIVQITEDSYVFDNLSSIPISIEHMYNLVPNKFDITTLKPFDKVLVRGNVGQKWIIDFFGFMDNDKGYPFVCVGHYVIQCIPYEGNEHLLDTSNDCDEFYKTW